MAITTEEQVELYQLTKTRLLQIERDIENTQEDLNREGLDRTLSISVRSLDYEDKVQIITTVLQMLEDKYENVSAELEEMLK